MIAPNDKMPPAEPMGLARKYIVRKADTGETVEDCFVLRPRKDWAARYAVRAYADMTRNTILRDDLLKWVGEFPISSYDPEYARIDQSKLQMKPCPRCGGKGLIYYEGPKYYYAECEDCPIELHEIYFSPESAADAWNYRAEKPNAPLTLEELREMAGEPVWVSTGRLSEWCIVHSCHSDDVIGGGVIMTRRTAEKRTYPYADCGKTWLAYRRKPEEIPYERLD